MNEPDIHDLLDKHQVKEELEGIKDLLGECSVCGNPVLASESGYRMGNGDVVHEDHFEEYAINELNAELIEAE
jgi:hypothetical protein